jgi:ABC-type polar amino acid transport system ATPase subunit
MSTLKIQGLCKAINNQVILHDICFAAQAGEVIALLGRSGSGKSTLLRCINLLTLPDAGLIEIGDHRMQFSGQDKSYLSLDINALRKKVGMVFQQFNLWPHLSVLDNLIAGPLYVLKQNKAEAIAAAENLLAKVGLSSKRDCYPTQLSGGQQQRAAIARSLMMKPDILLFDEPTSALDPEMVGDVLKTLRQLAAEGMTMIIATHELNFALKVANKSVFLDEGKMIEQGETKELFHRPQSAQLQRFMEAMNYG